MKELIYIVFAIQVLSTVFLATLAIMYVKNEEKKPVGGLGGSVKIVGSNSVISGSGGAGSAFPKPIEEYYK